MTLSNPVPPGEESTADTDLAAAAATVAAGAGSPWYLRLPILSHLRRSVGLQRGMLVTGLVLVIGLLLTACSPRCSRPTASRTPGSTA